MIKKVVINNKKNLNNIKFESIPYTVEDKIKRGYKYPIYPNVQNGDTIYNDIRLYLINRNNKSYRALYPKYISENEFSDNEKRYFRNKSKNFFVNKNGDLMIKRYNKKKKGNRNKDYTLFYVPLTLNLYNWINNIHIQLNHRSYFYLNYEIERKHYYYKGLANDIKNVLENCPICKIKNNKLMKREPCNVKLFVNSLNNDMLEI